jgi:hypothetical protein
MAADMAAEDMAADMVADMAVIIEGRELALERRRRVTVACGARKK